MTSPRANFAKVFINDEYIGLYTNTESVGKTFCNSNFGISGQTFIKCNPITNPSPVTKSNLRYLSADSSAYFNLYEMKSDKGWNELVELCDILTNNPETAHLSMDMDRVIWMLAFNIALVNLDSYSGVFAQNHYLYKDASARFSPIMWDMNMSFGGFPFAGSGNTSMGSLSIEQMQSLTPALHATDAYWPLIRVVMNNPDYRKLFFAHLRTIIEENISNDYYKQLAANLQQLISDAVQQDVNKFFSYGKFLTGLTENTNFLNYQVPGIAHLMDARVSYLNTNSEFSTSAPLIGNIELSDPTPELNSEITVSVHITNAEAVFFAYRTANYGPFTKVVMFDDGNHNDGQANDNVFGMQINLNVITTQFYIFASNNTAVKVYPAGAEHVFLEISASIPSIQPGDVAVNEFLAKNNAGVQNEYGEYADWIELINNTSEEISLYGLYLSDNPNNLTKWAFPQNAAIPAHGLLIIWADERPDTEGNIHCSFKLSADGEHVIISNVDGLIIDQVSFGPQTADVSLGRCPDGIGDWVSFNPPTMNQLNCTDGFDEKLRSYNLTIQPNPASSQLSYKLDLQVEITQT
ncbi:MAG: CotH kinase family protein, partial [Bacteroidales bacterium]|nr:CotH kinase family protein [Bacteroidales bacterium]